METGLLDSDEMEIGLLEIGCFVRGDVGIV